MSIEEFKLILETIGQITDGAKVIALLWILKGYFVPAVIVGGIIYVARMLIINVRGASDDTLRLQSLRDLLVQNYHGWVTPSEFALMLSKIQQLSSNNKESSK